MKAKKTNVKSSKRQDEFTGLIDFAVEKGRRPGLFRMVLELRARDESIQVVTIEANQTWLKHMATKIINHMGRDL